MEAAEQMPTMMAGLETYDLLSVVSYDSQELLIKFCPTTAYDKDFGEHGGMRDTLQGTVLGYVVGDSGPVKAYADAEPFARQKYFYQQVASVPEEQKEGIAALVEAAFMAIPQEKRVGRDLSGPVYWEPSSSPSP